MGTDRDKTKATKPAKIEPDKPYKPTKSNGASQLDLVPETGLDFQISDWNNYHEIDGDDEENYIVQLFGRTSDDHDVCLKVMGFTPFFYVEVPSFWNQHHAGQFVDELKDKVRWCAKNNPNYESEYRIDKALVRHKIVEKQKFENFENNKQSKFIMLVFKSYTGMKEFSNVLSRPFKTKNLTREPRLYQRYASNIEPHICFMHLNNISSCGWVTIPKRNLKSIDKYSNCDLTFSVNWKRVVPSTNDDRMAPFKIMGYDIECISCDANFPQAERKTDEIIQIGNTMYRYGSMTCYEQHILTLKQCALIEGATVECYRTEKALLRGWAKKVSELRPDFVVGYNTFGFDDKYIYDRIARIDQEEADRQKIPIEFLTDKFTDEILMIMGKLNNKYIVEEENLKHSLTSYQIKDLSSSALGDNTLQFFHSPGIISIDMMKIIQRDHRLGGYKLDNVSANFITESVNKVMSDEPLPNGTIPIRIYTNSTKALEKESYIQIMTNDSYSASPLSEGGKYYVYDIETVTDTKFDKKKNEEVEFVCQSIKIRLDAETHKDLIDAMANPLLKVDWTFAKDDMHHTLINKHHREGKPKMIRAIAKYCLKDCKLANLLLAKLDIIVNSMSMAKVCHVPFSYLILRGQGVKIFSLVSKKCREKNYLIPVLRRNKKDLDGFEEESYEGATVITPKPGVYLQPIGVLDYSSLYPNAMRERNCSHECYVNNPQYDNLPGYHYHDVFIVRKHKGKIIRNIDGTPVRDHHRYAQELITSEQINEELKSVFDKINTDKEEAIDKVQEKKYLSETNLVSIITAASTQVDKAIKEIVSNAEMKQSKKDRLIATIKSDFDEEFACLIKTNSKIKAYREKLALEIKTLDTVGVASATELCEKKILRALKDHIMTDDLKQQFIAKIEADAKKLIDGEITKRYNIVDGKTVRYGILPEILTELLNKRKETNYRLSQTKEAFIKTILSALQLAFKITANSLYGQTGAPTSPIFKVAIAASTTAIGRERLYFAKKIVDENFPGAEVIYGDTDSIFINFNVKGENGELLTNREARVKTIELSIKAANLINAQVPKPHSIIYEKVYHPFILAAKKKYVGLLYMQDPDKYELKSMGIVLKRRDNATIVKIVVGGIINYILVNRDINKAVEYVREVLAKLMEGEYPIEKFIISKALKARYKKPQTIAHKVLADRMAVRDPGNKPQVNDRIPFVYVVTDTGRKKKKDILQGDLIEHPEYVIENKLKIDYLYYLQHQIINPAAQILELMMPPRQVKKLFDEFIIAEDNKRKGRQSMEKWMDYSNVAPAYGSKMKLCAGSKTKKIMSKASRKKIVTKKPTKATTKSASVGNKSNRPTRNLPDMQKPNITFVGKTRRIECQNMQKWMASGALSDFGNQNAGDWEPTTE